MKPWGVLTGPDLSSGSLHFHDAKITMMEYNCFLPEILLKFSTQEKRTQITTVLLDGFSQIERTCWQDNNFDTITISY